MRVFAILLLITTVVLAERQNGRSGSRIVGGESTTIQRYPFMSNMELRLQGVFWTQSCGGSLITTRTILSAAHCYFGWTTPWWRARLGSTFASTGGSIHELSRILVHERYNHNTLDNDVAILTLFTPAVLSASIGIARIAGTNYNVADGALVTAVGWGHLWTNGPSSEVLQHVNVNIINQGLCTERYDALRAQPGFSNWPRITNGMLCAGVLNVGGRDACQGDSGGPLVQGSNVIVGVTSWGFTCGHYYYPGVNARVTFYANWIVANGST